MREIDPWSSLNQLGCISDDRNVGPWERTDNGAWIRKGPVGFRSLYSDEVAYVSAGGWDAYGPDGLVEDSGHIWGERKDDDLGRQCTEDLKAWVDGELRTWGWIVDGQAYKQPSAWQRLKMFFGLKP